MLGFDNWYDFYLLPSCYAAADLYYAAVSGDTAAKHFQEGSQELCDCACADSDYAICTTGSKTCQRVRGLGASDGQNCGGCGQSCGDKAYCSNGLCHCKPAPPTPDQCGNLCLDFHTHPRNCGGCGNVCASGYCYQGTCFTPPANADKCYPVDALTNGNFANGLIGWSVPSDPNFTALTQLSTGPKSGEKSLLATAILNSGLPNTYVPTLTITTTLRLCPGVQYKLDFQLSTTSTISKLSFSVGGKDIGVNEQVPYTILWLAKGPYTLPVFNKGDASTSEDGLFLDVELDIHIYGSTSIVKIADVAVYSTDA